MYHIFCYLQHEIYFPLCSLNCLVIMGSQEMCCGMLWLRNAMPWYGVRSMTGALCGGAVPCGALQCGVVWRCNIVVLLWVTKYFGIIQKNTNAVYAKSATITIVTGVPAKGTGLCLLSNTHILLLPCLCDLRRYSVCNHQNHRLSPPIIPTKHCPLHGTTEVMKCCCSLPPPPPSCCLTLTAPSDHT